MVSFSNVIYQYILSILRDSEFTSASPSHTNKFKGIDGSPEGIGTDEEFEETLKQIVEDVVNEMGIVSEKSEQELAEDLLNAETKNKSKKGNNEALALSTTRKGLQISQHPESILPELLLHLPHAKLVAIVAILIPIIYDQLTRPGGTYDVRFKRRVENEINGFLSRQTQKDTQMGIRKIFIQSEKGFTAVNGANNYNTVRGIREGGINKEREDRFGLVPHRKGVFDIG